MRLSPRPYATALLRALTAPDADAAAILRRFARLLMKRRDTRLLPSIIRAFEKLYDAKTGILSVTAVTPEPLSAEAQAHLRTRIEDALSAEVWLRSTADTALLAGAVFTIGDQRIDASVRGHLESIRKAIRH